jgi:hypothetical protein
MKTNDLVSTMSSGSKAGGATRSTGGSGDLLKQLAKKKAQAAMSGSATPSSGMKAATPLGQKPAGSAGTF